MKTALDNFNQALDRGLSKAVFDHLRNLLMCALLFTVGAYAHRHPSETIFGVVSLEDVAGILIFIIAGSLTLLNLIDGVHKLPKMRLRGLLQFVLIVVYVLVSIRIIELTWQYRLSNL